MAIVFLIRIFIINLSRVGFLILIIFAIVLIIVIVVIVFFIIIIVIQSLTDYRMVVRFMSSPSIKASLLIAASLISLVLFRICLSISS